MNYNIKTKLCTIFVSIASYRDDECNSTLSSIYENAANPANIFVGIVQQNDPTSLNSNDNDCVLNNNNKHNSYYHKYLSNIRIIRIPHYQAKGPTYARYLCSTLLGDEEYFMQVDSHTKFVPNWDSKCMKMINDILKTNLSKKPILSHYPKSIDDYMSSVNYNTASGITSICKAFFNERGMISFEGAKFVNNSDVNGNKIYLKNPYIAGGFCFGPSKFVHEVPYDPDLPYLFVGEEILHSIRLYTHGWDFFVPIEDIVFHEYTRENKPKIWSDNKHYDDTEAHEKVKKYIGLTNDKSTSIDTSSDRYGLGKIRTLDDYYNFAGINIGNKIINKDFCDMSKYNVNGDYISQNQNDNTNIIIPSAKYVSYNGIIYSTIAIIISIIIIYKLKFQNT